MSADPGLADAAELFKVLGSTPRLWLLHLLAQEPRSVGALVEATDMSQPLVSQHLRTLRLSGLVSASRAGREVTYQVTDVHVSHVISDAVAHVREPRTHDADPPDHPDHLDHLDSDHPDTEATP